MSVRAAGICRDTGTADAALEKAEIGLIHITILVQIGRTTRGIARNGWAGYASLEQAEVVDIHVAVAIEISGHR